MRSEPDADGQVLDLRFAAGASELTGMVDRVEAYATAAALPANIAARLALVCEEWAANVVEHGTTGPGGATAMRLSVRRRAAALHVVAEDDGLPFDPLAMAAPDAAAVLDQRQPGGLGLHLMRRVARQVRYERVGPINRLALVIELDF